MVSDVFQCVTVPFSELQSGSWVSRDSKQLLFLVGLKKLCFKADGGSKRFRVLNSEKFLGI